MKIKKGTIIIAVNFKQTAVPKRIPENKENFFS